MIERSLILFAVVLAVVIASLVIRAVSSRRTTAIVSRSVPEDLVRRLPGAGVVYFSGPHCPTCRQQGLVLDRLKEETGVSVLRIDAVEEPALAQTLGVMTVPTTVLVDMRCRVRAVNPGYRPLSALAKQVQDLEA
jgi:thiol-disulfide isomerase/thioredoxin